MTTPARSYTHPTLGKLNWDVGSWVGEIELPAFAKFDLPFPKGRYELVIAAESFNEAEPSSKLLNVAEKLVESHDKLAEAIPLALWQELTGEGPDSGMWWHGGIPAEEIPQLVGPDAPEGSEDLMDFMELMDVQCTPQLGDEKPAAEFRFSAPWEQEHGGMGVLVEDGTVTGIGYGSDGVSRFRYLRPKKEKLTINPFTGEPIE